MASETMSMSLFDRVERSLTRDRHLPLSQVILKAARWTGQRVVAPLYLADCDAVGPGARVRGRPAIFNRGRIAIGARFNVSSMFARAELSTAPSGEIAIGDDVTINFGARITAERRITIGDRVALGPYVSIDDGDRDGEALPITIGDDAWLAARVRVRAGATIGAGAVITAGSDVRGNIPAGAVAGGVPARVLRSREVEPLALSTSAPPKPPDHRGVLVADFSIQELARHLRTPDPLGPSVESFVAPFDQVVPTLHAIDRYVTESAVDFALVWARPESIAGFARLRLGEEVAIEAILEEVDAFAALVEKAAAAVPRIFLASFASPPDVRGLGMLDLRANGLAGTILRMNLRLLEQLAPASNVFVLDAQRWIASGGASASVDKLWYQAKVGYSSAVLAEAARDVRAALRGIRGGAKKVIVLDLDDTLWGGIVGDVGWEGLRLGGHDAVGEAYVAFQRELKALARRGVLLAIASKNEESVALDAMTRHPAMVLRPGDFTARRINWNDKAANIAELAAELNLGLASMVFLDDNPVERARIREALPEVFVPDLPAEPLEYAHALRALRCFDVPAISREDASRAAMMAEDRERAALKTQVGSLDEWLAGLMLHARFARLDASNLARTAQLLNKTNQMNLSTRRLSDAELTAWAKEKGREVWAVSVSDRIGDAGLTGILSIEVDGEVARIVDFVLSCRVMGRRIEDAMTSVAVDRARALGARAVEARFEETSKNMPCRSFWDRSGFVRDPATDVYRLAVDAPHAPPAAIALEGIPVKGDDHA